MGRGGKLAAAGAVGILVGLGASFTVPSLYASQTVLLMLGPTTPEARVDLINALAQRSWPRIVLARMIEHSNLYGGSAGSLQDQVSEMRSHISAKPVDKAANHFAIRFEYGDPMVAQKVVGELTQRLLDENHHGDELGIPGAYFRTTSPPNLPRFPSSPKRWLLACEGLALGLIAGSFLAFRKPRKSS